MRTTQKLSVGASVVVALLAAFFGVPEEAGAQELAQVYEVTPKSGAHTALESALKSHSEWRENNGDPWSWSVAEIVEGKHTGSFYIRSGGHDWSDFDEYWQGFGAEAGAHYEATVQPHVESTTSYVVRVDTSASYMPEEGLDDISLYSLNTYELKPGHGGDWYDAVEAIHDAMAKVGYPDPAWVVDFELGAHDPDARLVFPKENWAGFEEPEQSVGEIVEKVYGEEKTSEIFDQFSNSVRSYENMVQRIRPDLSVEGADQEGGQ